MAQPYRTDCTEVPPPSAHHAPAPERPRRAPEKSAAKTIQQRQDLTRDCVGSVEGKEMSPTHERELRAESVGERPRDLVDREIAILFTPEDERGNPVWTESFGD